MTTNYNKDASPFKKDASHVAKPASPTPAHQLGQEFGLLRSISEKKQAAIIVVCLLVFGSAWQLELIGGGVMIFGSTVTMIGIYLLALQFGDSMRVFEGGLVLRKQGKLEEVVFDDVTSISAKETHHYYRRAYVGTKAQLTVELANRLSDLRFECDYRRGDAKELLVHQAIDACSRSVQLRLQDQLNAEGEILWKDNIYLTERGLKIEEPVSESRIVAFSDIEELQMRDNQLKIWKRGDAMPFMVLSNESPNFAPMLGLFRTLTKLPVETENEVSEESTEESAIAIASASLR